MAGYDAIIVGTRCAGAPLAMLLARRGLRVLGIDRATFPSDTISTHFMFPRTTAFLHAWGLLARLAQTGCPLIETVTLDYGPVRIRGAPSAVDGSAAMYCPRRHILDMLLVAAAREAGAEIREAMTVRDLIWDADRVVGVRADNAQGEAYDETATVVIGADGLWSRVARAAGAPIELDHAALTGGYFAYWQGVPTDGVEFYLRHRREILVFPTHDAMTCTWVGWPHDEFASYSADIEANYLATLALAPALASRVRDGRRAAPFKGTNKLPNYYRRAFGRGWALVGDAAYHRDPITGMGIGDAFLGAQLLADSLAAAFGGSASFDQALEGYGRALRERTQNVFQYTLRAAALDDPAPLVPFYAATKQDPEAVRTLMDVVAGAVPAATFFNRANVARIVARAS
jgi:2-polyprenyl-6-methoxyphenol hydroxylase-like FAD-dependent oxidoreductase